MGNKTTETLSLMNETLSTITETLPTLTEILPTTTPTKIISDKAQENTAAFVIAAIIGIVVIGFSIFTVYKMILKRREDAEKARNAEKLSKITGKPKKTVTFKDEVESDQDVLKNKYADDSDASDSDEDSGIKIDLEDDEDTVDGGGGGCGDDSSSADEDDDDEFDIDEDVDDEACIKIDIIDCRQNKHNVDDEVKVDLSVS